MPKTKHNKKATSSEERVGRRRSTRVMDRSDKSNVTMSAANSFDMNFSDFTASSPEPEPLAEIKWKGTVARYCSPDSSGTDNSLHSMPTRKLQQETILLFTRNGIRPSEMYGDTIKHVCRKKPIDSQVGLTSATRTSLWCVESEPLNSVNHTNPSYKSNSSNSTIIYSLTNLAPIVDEPFTDISVEDMEADNSHYDVPEEMDSVSNVFATDSSSSVAASTFSDDIKIINFPIQKSLSKNYSNANIISTKQLQTILKKHWSHITLSRGQIRILESTVNTELKNILDKLMLQTKEKNYMFNFKELESILQSERLILRRKNSLILSLATSLTSTQYRKAVDLFILPKNAE